MSLSLFDAEPPQVTPPRKAGRKRKASAKPAAVTDKPRMPRSPAPRAPREPFPEQYGIEPEPSRPEIQSAHYWARQLVLATTPERKAECHRMMVLSLLAIDHRGGRLQ